MLIYLAIMYILILEHNVFILSYFDEWGVNDDFCDTLPFVERYNNEWFFLELIVYTYLIIRSITATYSIFPFEEFYELMLEDLFPEWECIGGGFSFFYLTIIRSGWGWRILKKIFEKLKISALIVLFFYIFFTTAFVSLLKFCLLSNFILLQFSSIFLFIFIFFYHFFFLSGYATDLLDKIFFKTE